MPDTTFDHRPSAARSYLQGTQPLWKAFWLLYVGGHLLGWLLSHAGFTWAVAYWAPQWISGWAMQLAVVAGVALLLMAYLLLCLWVVWRCSAQHPSALWRWAARAVIVLHALCWLTSIGMVVHFYGSGWGAPLLQGLAP